MKTTLTEKQKETLDFIEQQFVEMNAKNQNVGFNLLDINKLNAEINRIDISKTELKVHNAGMEKARLEICNKIIAQLNADFFNGNLPLIAKPSWGDVLIRPIDVYYNHDGSAYISMHINGHGNTHEFGIKIMGFSYANTYSGSTKCDVDTKTPEEFLAHPKTQKRIMRLIDFCKNHKWKP